MTLLSIYLIVGIGVAVYVGRNDIPPRNWRDRFGMALLAGVVALVWPTFLIGSLVGRYLGGHS